MSFTLSPSEVLQLSIDAVLLRAETNFGKKYSEGSDRLGPNAYDCSSYVWDAYLVGGSIDIGKDTQAQLENPQGTQVLPSNTSIVNPTGGPSYTYADLQPGDLIYWGNNLNDLNSQHVEMFAGTNLSYGGQSYTNSPTTPVVVAEYHSGDVAHPSYLGLNPNGTFSGDGVAPILAVVRFQNAILTEQGISGPYDPTQRVGAPPSTLSSAALASATTAVQASPPSLADLPDPRNNLPFSSYFMSQRTNFGSYTGVSPLYAERHLVRGGIAESVGGSPRPGGRLICYFMMNPATISVDYSIDTSKLPMPTSNTAASNSIPVATTNAGTISFQVIFNRMYEVWRGDTVFLDGQGPSVIGCRWDVRAMERLIGIYDNTNTANPTGINGVGNNVYPLIYPVQVVFGSQDSIIFNGYITSLSYQYTLFSKDMVPIEAYVNVSIMAMWLSDTGKDIINSIVNVPSDYYTPAGSGAPQVSKTGPLSGFLGVSS